MVALVPYWVPLLVALAAGAVGYVTGQWRGQALGRAEGSLEGWQEGRDEGRLRGLREGFQAGRAEALSYFEIRQEPLVRRVGIWPVRALREGVRHELWFHGIPTTFVSERWSTSELDVDERAMRGLVEAGVRVLVKGATGGLL